MWLVGSIVFLALSTVLPWLQVAGSTRSGLASAELLVSLATAGAPEGLRVLGVLWYIGAFVGLLTWAVAAIGTADWQVRGAGAGLVAVTGCWLGFVVWSATDDRILVEWAGPVGGLAGVAMLGALIGSISRR